MSKVYPVIDVLFFFRLFTLKILYLITFISFTTPCKSQEIKNVHFEQDGDSIFIYYDLIPSDYNFNSQEYYEVKVFFKNKDARTKEIELASLKGDVGFPVQNGYNKKITWYVTTTFDSLVSNNIVFIIKANSSQYHKNSSTARYSSEIDVEDIIIQYGLGLAFFTGDVGGSESYRSKNLNDINLNAFRPSLLLGTRFYFSNKYSISANFSYLRLYANDNLSKSKFEQNRNLNFVSNVYCFSITPEFSIFSSETRYSNFELMIFSGLGFFSYISKSKIYINYNPMKLNLNQCGTEGQGIIEGVPKYKTTAFTLPLGVEFIKYYGYFYVSLRFTYNLTTTNYIDDVGGTYFDKEKLAQMWGKEVAEISDKRINPDLVFENIPANTRGYSETNDKFGNILFTVGYKLDFGQN